MSFPIPFGVILSPIYRAYTAMRQNPCRIEVFDEGSRDGKQWARIRNDSTLPVQLFGVSFLWKRGKEVEYQTPLVWELSEHTKAALAPGHSFEHPVDAHEYGIGAKWCEIVVTHNRSPHPERKRFKPKQ